MRIIDVGGHRNITSVSIYSLVSKCKDLVELGLENTSCNEEFFDLLKMQSIKVTKRPDLGDRQLMFYDTFFFPFYPKGYIDNNSNKS